MKQYIFKGLLLLSVITLTASCQKSLKEYNPSGMTAESVFTTPEGFETLVNAAYSYQRWWYGKEEGFGLSEMGTDIWMSGAGDVATDLTQYINLQGTNGAITTEWQQLYAAVNLCNTGINRIFGAGLSATARPIREAELRFLRAFYYWHIVETWGGVHFSLAETQGVITTANKTPVETFNKQIIEDLLFAVERLPVTTTDYGRVTKPAAQAFLARMYLTQKKYTEAKAMALAVINGGYGFTLLPNYADLWKMSNLKNKEVVYAVNYAVNLSLNDLSDPILNPLGHSRGSNNGHMLFAMKYDDQAGMFRDIANGRPFNRYMPTRFLLDLYSDNDARYEGSFKTVWFANSTSRPAGMAIGDTAVFATKKVYAPIGKLYKVYDRNAVYNANGTVKDQLHYVSLNKFDDPTRTSTNEAQSARDSYVIRFAELYLIAAEAEFNLGNPDQAATYLNVVRTRAAKAGKVAEMQLTGSQVTLDLILDERAREFAGEQLRWFDLKRTGKLIERVKANNPNAAGGIQDFHLVRPIPRTQVDAVTNKDEFKQNPGYQ
ncbi:MULTISPECIES: RagB/SusD family nutrient uptake outer membrane protein [unclassified Pedobacter]|uniref:RagB/SusD family nutrient uptake outer membrane protein n=1 Tax=unclassified Pedobacter TaxID=2628915 RepID=UPI001D2A5E56|nr:MULTISPECIES: RagB/SusD family nutrient uptake outer membrane protein [unclassified Pedobacter]CAH0138977.1 SusD-like protein BACOVA_02651 [Pedobacter sp. Bi126]CAH0219502.1 SusD-like protein BACOVA_02651 [Pedobacter sp. Bi36]